MRENGLRGAYLRKGWSVARPNSIRVLPPPRTCSGATSPPPHPTPKWVADLTRILTGEGVLWLASVRDVFFTRALSR